MQHVSLKARATRLAATGVATLALLGCTAPYVPYSGDNAAKLRLRPGVGPAWLGTLASNLRPVVNGRCGEQLGKLSTDLAQVAGGVEALARLGGELGVGWRASAAERHRVNRPGVDFVVVDR